MSAVSTEFRNEGGTTSTNVIYNAREARTTGNVYTKSTGDTEVLKPATVLVGVEARGNNTASWEPELTVSLPDDSLTGEYRGVVTTSVV